MKNAIDGNKKNNKLTGTSGADKIDGMGGNDVIKGLAGQDKLIGGNGNDTLDGGTGKDNVSGGKGNDKILVSAGADQISGGKGMDTLDARGWEDGVWLNLASFASTDFATQETGQTVRVDALTMKLRDDGASDDWVVQQISNDFENFIGSDSRDWINLSTSFDANNVQLGGGNDYFVANSAKLVDGGKGNDRISIDFGTAKGGRGNDTLSAQGNDGDAKLLGGNGNDRILIGVDTVAKGGKGNDTLVFLAGDRDNKVFGGNGADIFEFNSLGGTGVMRDFQPGVDKIDLSGYAGTDPSINWDSIQGMFQGGNTGVKIKLDSDRFSNQEFEFSGLSRNQLSEDDFIF